MTIAEIDQQIEKIRRSLSLTRDARTGQILEGRITQLEAEKAQLMAKSQPKPAAPAPTPAPAPKSADSDLDSRIEKLERKLQGALKMSEEGNDTQKASALKMIPEYRRELTQLKGMRDVEPEVPVAEVETKPAARRGRPAKMRQEEPAVSKPAARRGRPAKMRQEEPAMPKPAARRGRPARIRQEEPAMPKPAARRGRPAKMRQEEPAMPKPAARRGRPAKMRQEEPAMPKPAARRGRPARVRQEEPVMPTPAARRGRPAKIKREQEPVTPTARRGRPTKIQKPTSKELSPKALMALVEALMNFKSDMGLAELTMEELYQVIAVLDKDKLLKYKTGGKISKTGEYIPRKDIKQIILNSGMEISNNGTLMSGVWTKKKMKANGGQVELDDSDIDIDFSSNDYGYFVIKNDYATVSDGVNEYTIEDNGVYMGKMIGDDFYIIQDDGFQMIASEDEWEIAFQEGGGLNREPFVAYVITRNSAGESFDAMKNQKLDENDIYANSGLRNSPITEILFSSEIGNSHSQIVADAMTQIDEQLDEIFPFAFEESLYEDSVFEKVGEDNSGLPVFEILNLQSFNAEYGTDFSSAQEALKSPEAEGILFSYYDALAEHNDAANQAEFVLLAYESQRNGEMVVF